MMFNKSQNIYLRFSFVRLPRNLSVRCNKNHIILYTTFNIRQRVGMAGIETGLLQPIFNYCHHKNIRANMGKLFCIDFLWEYMLIFDFLKVLTTISNW